MYGGGEQRERNFRQVNKVQNVAGKFRKGLAKTAKKGYYKDNEINWR